MEPPAAGLAATAFCAGEDFLDVVAAALLARYAEAVLRGDLSSIVVLVPTLPVAGELRSALLRAAPQPFLLPRFETLARWVATLPGAAAIADPLPDSQRLVLLHEALRERRWFDEAALWAIAAELAGLFDELSGRASGALPDNEAALRAELEQAYALRASAPLAFEARVVHELWRALSVSGQLDARAVYRLRLAAAARAASGHACGSRPLIVLLDDVPEAALESAEIEFLGAYAEHQPLAVFHPAPRAPAVTSPLMQTLAAAWPETPAAVALPLFERAAQLARSLPESPLRGRLQLVPTAGREHEAQAAVAQIGAWLDAGLRRIVVITQDRLTTRRVRALLEREGVLASDETGWKLSTSRAAAAVDALIETAAAGAFYRDVIELCKSPYVFSDHDENARKSAAFAIEGAVRAASIRSGLPRIRQAVLAGKADETVKADALALLDRIAGAAARLASPRTTLAAWIVRLQGALEGLGALDALTNDSAGRVLLDLLEARRNELVDSAALFSLAAWRDWLNRQIESAHFRDERISSPVVMTPLNAVSLRRFDAALLIGGDAGQLAPAAAGQFFNESVRRQLGLPTRADGERQLRHDLEVLLASVPCVTVTWQSTRAGEANLLAPELALLATLHKLAWNDDLHRAPLPARSERQPEPGSAPGATEFAAPRAPLELIPQRVSVSAYASLVACPYRFFARHVLGLGEMDEVAEEMGKSDYGALVHRVLERFHGRHPVLAELAENEALAALQGCVSEVFAAAIEDNFLAIGWRLRWERRLPAYLDWQRRREAAGWRWTQAEVQVSRVLPLAGSASVELYGRIDRIDRLQGAPGAPSGVSLLDYKTQSAKAIGERLKDDVQLPAYALLHGNAAEAAYVALDDETIVAVSAGDEPATLDAAAQAQGRRLQAAMSALQRGAPLPAHGVSGVCRWCEMSGLCRKEYV